MPRYRHILTDLRTGKVLSDAVTLNVSSYAARLCGPADLSATLELSDPAVRAMSDPILATQPRRTALWIIRDERPVWGGIIWTRRYRSSDHNLDLGASTFESYFARRRIRRSYGFVQWDQHDIIAHLVATAQSEPAGGIGNIGIAVAGGGNSGGWQPQSGIRRDRSYFWHERATYLERMQHLAEVINGPDFAITPVWRDGPAPVANLQIGTPIRRPGEVTLEFPGDFRNYSWPDDGGNSANFWSAIGDVPAGSADDAPPLIRDAQVSAEWEAGYPLLEDVSTHQGVVDAVTLSAYAIANVAAAAGNRVVMEATLRLPTSELPALGDVLEVRITDPYRWPATYAGAPGIIAHARLTGYAVYLSEDEGETVALTLTEAW